MKFIESSEMKIDITKEQQKQLCSKKNIIKIARKKGVITFDIYDEDLLIGFAQLYEYKKNCYFLWNYAIDTKYQNMQYGTKALIDLIAFLKENYQLIEMTTTYLWGNEHAKHIYEKVGFTETSVVHEGKVHEVNMIYK